MIMNNNRRIYITHIILSLHKKTHNNAFITLYHTTNHFFISATSMPIKIAAITNPIKTNISNFFLRLF